jgi:HEAT repeat protein
VRKAAVKTLAVWGAKEQIPALGQALTHNDVFTRKAAIEALATFKEEQQAGDLIAKRLPEGAERGDASKALQAMGPVGQTAALKYMKHTEWTVRLEVCNILKVVGTQQCLKALQAAAAQDQNGIVRMAAGEAAQIAATRK